MTVACSQCTGHVHYIYIITFITSILTYSTVEQWSRQRVAGWTPSASIPFNVRLRNVSKNVLMFVRKDVTVDATLWSWYCLKMACKCTKWFSRCFQDACLTWNCWWTCKGRKTAWKSFKTFENFSSVNKADKQFQSLVFAFSSWEVKHRPLSKCYMGKFILSITKITGWICCEHLYVAYLGLRI